MRSPCTATRAPRRSSAPGCSRTCASRCGARGSGPPRRLSRGPTRWLPDAVRHPNGMPTPPNTRSIKIDADERTGWSSDRPRPGGGPPRKADVSTRCRVLAPSDLLRYSPGSMLMVVSASKEARDQFVDRLIETKAAVLSQDKVRELLAGRVDEDRIDEAADQLLEKAALKRLEA